jgi:hypothetical protein
LYTHWTLTRDSESITQKKLNGIVEKEERKEKWRRHRSSSTDGQVAPARNTIICMCVYIHTKKEKKKKKRGLYKAHTIVYEEGKEKEKMFFFSALRAVVHLEKAISEPDITIQKEKERTRNLACTRIKRGKKRMEARERKRAITKTNERERGQDDEQKYTRHSNWGQIILYMTFRKDLSKIYILYRYLISLNDFFLEF